VIEALADVMLFRGIPENIRSYNGPESLCQIRAFIKVLRGPFAESVRFHTK
jgi:hypothetical protein